MKQLIKISRTYLDYLKKDNNMTKDNLIRPFLFDSLLKTIMLLVDNVLNSMDKEAEDRAKSAINKI
jgi:hypothetical protein